MKLEFSWQFLIHNQISNFMEICPVRAEFFHADGQTDIKKLIFTFCSFANMPKHLFRKSTQYFPEIKWVFFSMCVCVWRGGGSSTWFYAACSVDCGCGYVLVQCSVQYRKTLGSASNICNTRNYAMMSVSLYFMNSELFFPLLLVSSCGISEK